MVGTDVLQELEALGSEQTRKTYKRHGVGENMFGVSYANLGKLHKRFKVNQGLALELWRSGNHDARILASMIADPQQMDGALLEEWVKDLSNYVLTDAVANIASRTPLASEKMAAWTQSDKEWIGRAGWQILANLAMKDTTLPDEFFENYLEVIERNIHSAKNFVRNAMNSALIAIGIRNAALEEKALASAAKIGKVIVDHGETSCKTPDAIPYIQKANQRKKPALK